MNVTLVDSMGTDLSVVNAARVSFAKVSESGILFHTLGLRQEFLNMKMKNLLTTLRNMIIGVLSVMVPYSFTSRHQYLSLDNW